MDIASLIAFGILLLAWLVLPVKETETASLSVAVQKLLTSKHTA